MASDSTSTAHYHLEQPKSDTHSMPKVSIGMPVYNSEVFIRDALDSLLAQTFTDFELIISDNASADDTEMICREYALKDKRIRYVRQAENRGAVANFQFVLDESVGDYFMWAAGDDIWSSTFISDNEFVLSSCVEIQLSMSMYSIVSIRFPWIRMDNFQCMGFLDNPNQSERLCGYLSEPEPSHKANLIYGLWRRDTAQIAITYLRNLGVNAFYGGDKNAIINLLISFRAFQINKNLFCKRYSNIPPGHPFSQIFSLMNLFSSKKRRRALYAYSIERKELIKLLQSEISLLSNCLIIAVDRYFSCLPGVTLFSNVLCLRESFRRAGLFLSSR